VEVAADQRLVAPVDGRAVSFLGLEAVLKIRGEQTSGALSIAEFTVAPGGYAPPHYHERTDEVSYVLEGELGVWLAEDEFRAPAGTFVVRPKQVPHAFWNDMSAPVRFLDMYMPAGFERWFEVLARLFESGPPAPAELDEAGRRHDVILLPDRAQEIAERHGLAWPPEPPPPVGR
jgi:quercetin dioxygenase-like cupin family protein